MPLQKDKGNGRDKNISLLEVLPRASHDSIFVRVERVRTLRHKRKDTYKMGSENTVTFKPLSPTWVSTAIRLVDAAADALHTYHFDYVTCTGRGTGYFTPYLLDAQAVVDRLSDCYDDHKNPRIVHIVREDDPKAWDLATDALQAVYNDDYALPVVVCLGPVEDSGFQRIFTY